jgi:hypothetical protein
LPKFALGNDKKIYYYLCRTIILEMSKTVKLREYPLNEQPAILSASNWGVASEEDVQKVFDFFSLVLHIDTLRRTTSDHRPYIEGSFLGKDKRKVSLRFFYIGGVFRNVIFNDNINDYSDIRTFKRLYQETPYL